MISVKLGHDFVKILRFLAEAFLRKSQIISVQSG